MPPVVEAVVFRRVAFPFVIQSAWGDMHTIHLSNATTLRYFPILERLQKYDMLSRASKDMHECLQEAIVARASPNTRFFGYFYRVGLYGKLFGDHNGVEFVYVGTCTSTASPGSSSPSPPPLPHLHHDRTSAVFRASLDTKGHAVRAQV